MVSGRCSDSGSVCHSSNLCEAATLETGRKAAPSLAGWVLRALRLMSCKVLEGLVRGVELWNHFWNHSRVVIGGKPKTRTLFPT